MLTNLIERLTRPELLPNSRNEAMRKMLAKSEAEERTQRAEPVLCEEPCR